MTRFIPFFISIFGFTVLLQSQTYYVKFDPSCLNRYEFVTDIDKTPYVVYTTNKTSGGITQLDIGKEQVKWVKNLPSNWTSCSLISFDKAMALAVNNSTVKLYIVRESPTHFNISPVEKATYIVSDSRSLEITMADADFVMDWERMISNKNLATPASTKDVYLEGTIKYQCLTGYIFKKKDSNQTNSYKEYTIIPSMGIINKRSVPYEGAVTNALRLDRVANKSTKEYIASKCIGKSTTPGSDAVATQPINYQETRPEQPTIYESEIYAKGADVPTSYANIGPCGPPTMAGTHFVQKGETLYGISRRYGISVDQLRAWNGIGKDNTILICQELVVKKSTTTTTPGSGTGAGNSTTGTTTPKGGNFSQYHIVRPNESVRQLAAMYGYTEERFRKMNGLGTYERVYAGQKVFTSDCDCPNIEGVASDVPMPYEAETERLTTGGKPDVYFRPIKVHVVKANETLFAIARQYDTTVDRIKELNGLEKSAGLNKDQRIYVQ